MHPVRASIKSELVQLKLNIDSSVGDSTPTEAEPGVPLPIVEVGVLRLDKHILSLVFQKEDLYFIL